MIKILIITNDFDKWWDYIEERVNIFRGEITSNEIILMNDLFYFSLRHSVNKSDRGQAWAHVILDKKIDCDLEKTILIPSINQHITKNINLLSSENMIL